ncbi:hypothetical protein AB1Y20_022483 [Prymnesium parvum]|uniref:PX domain-containing protein n=1 Tax=Prymnesium parvum TaxID=97485 RepID=A0AB34JHA3_PRYPA
MRRRDGHGFAAIPVTLTVRVTDFFDAADITLYVLSVTATAAGRHFTLEAHRRYGAFVALHESSEPPREHPRREASEAPPRPIVCAPRSLAVFALYADTLPRRFPVRKALINHGGVKRRRAVELEHYLCGLLRCTRPLPQEVLAFLGLPPLGVVAATLRSAPPGVVAMPPAPLREERGAEGGDEHGKRPSSPPERARALELVTRLARLAVGEEEAPPAHIARPLPLGWLADAPVDELLSSALFAPLGGCGRAADACARFLELLRREGSREAVLALLEVSASQLLDGLAHVLWGAVVSSGQLTDERDLQRYSLALTAEEAAASLRHAVCAANLPLVRALLHAGCDPAGRVDGKGTTALMEAACAGRADVVQCLVDGGARVDETDANEETALHAACRAGHPAVVRVLLDAGACAEAWNAKGRRPLMLASAEGHTEVVLEMLRSADVNAGRSSDGIASLHLALARGHEGAAKVCRRASPRHGALSHGFGFVPKALLTARAGVSARLANGIEPLMCAAQGRLDALVEPLLAAKAEIDATTDEGWSALHWACSCGAEKVARTLMLAGAMVVAMTKDGSTPLSLAQDGGHESLCLLLDVTFTPKSAPPRPSDPLSPNTALQTVAATG